MRKNGKTSLVMNKLATLQKSSLQIVTFNLQPLIRHDEMEGRPFIVAPMVMITEGVHAGSEGPLLYPSEELSKTPAIWNHKPIIVYHPAPGQSACDPDVINSRKIGLIMNTKFEDGKLKAEAWLEPTRMEKVDNRVAEAIENGEMVELSTGVFTDNELTGGEWNGEKYDAIARNYRADHLAILPDQTGACSIADGAGLLRLNQAIGKNPKLLRRIASVIGNAMALNELSHSNTWDALWTLIRERNGDDAWIEDVYDSFFIFSDKGTLFKQNYSETDNQVTLGDMIEEVIRVTEYRTLNGTFVGNKKKEIKMKRKDAVDALIANSQWTEDERDFLMEMKDSEFEKLVKNEEATPDAPVTPAAPDAPKTDVQIAAEEGAADVIAPAANPPAENKEELGRLLNTPQSRGAIRQSLITRKTVQRLVEYAQPSAEG